MRKQIEGTVDLHPVYGVFPEVYVKLEERTPGESGRSSFPSRKLKVRQAKLRGLLNLGGSERELCVLRGDG